VTCAFPLLDDGEVSSAVGCGLETSAQLLRPEKEPKFSSHDDNNSGHINGLALLLAWQGLSTRFRRSRASIGRFVAASASSPYMTTRLLKAALSPLRR
jgi:hypothetical protein